MINVKTFNDKYNNNKKFHHVNLFGLSLGLLTTSDYLMQMVEISTEQVEVLSLTF